MRKARSEECSVVFSLHRAQLSTISGALLLLLLVGVPISISPLACEATTITHATTPPICTWVLRFTRAAALSACTVSVRAIIPGRWNRAPVCRLPCEHGSLTNAPKTGRCGGGGGGGCCLVLRADASDDKLRTFSHRPRRVFSHP